MKVVILAGGYGTRISEESQLKPKPMIEIGGKPILWHIMKIYSYYGFNDFIICLGYMGYSIKNYFEHYFLYESDVTFDFTQDNRKIVHHHSAEPWRVTLVNTGLDTMTGGRIKQVQDYIGSETFLLTYGDGVADVNIQSVVDFHLSHGRLATVTSVQPSGRFGAMDLGENQLVNSFHEKPRGDGAWVNGGFFVLEPSVLQYISGDSISFENEPLEHLAQSGELMAYKHHGFWQPMDTLRDKRQLENLWQSGHAPWKLWTDKREEVSI